jgi:Flp pilus assembly protein TadD
MNRAASLALLATAVWLSPAPARADVHPPSLMVRADSAWARGDWSVARRLYADVLSEQPRQSRAVFRLARLTKNQEQALRLHRRYIALEPNDPWGYMAAGDVLSHLGRTGEALEEYDQAARLKPAERDVAVGRARVLDAAGRRDEAAAVRQAWLSGHPGDAAVWSDLGRTWLQVGQPRRAVQALERALAGGPDPDVERRLQLARALDGPAIEPLVTSARDSDGNRANGVGSAADVTVGEGVRLGVQVMRTRIDDGASRGFVDESRLRLTLRPRSTWRIEAATGSARLDPRDGTTPARPWLGALRARWRAAQGSPALEVRAERIPLAATPPLLAHHAMRNEGRVGFEWPMRALRLRGTLRGATIESANGHNGYTAAEGTVALAVRPTMTPWAQYRVSGYRDPTEDGYFAPRRSENVEVGSYFEVGDGAPWLFTLDLGTGLQRHAPHGRPLGPWGPALHSYGYLSYALHRGCELRLEAETGNSSGFMTSASEGWRYGSLSLGLRWALI